MERVAHYLDAKSETKITTVVKKDYGELWICEYAY